MTIVNFIKKLVTELLAPVEAHYAIDAVAYHERSDERELRFSPISALRRHY